MGFFLVVDFMRLIFILLIVSVGSKAESQY